MGQTRHGYHDDLEVQGDVHGHAGAGAPDGSTAARHALREPIADIVPPSPERQKPEWLGSLRGTIEIRGDIVTQSSEPVPWEGLK